MMMTHTRISSALLLPVAAGLLCLLTAGCSSQPEKPKEAAKEMAPAPAPAPAPAEEKKPDANIYKVKFETTKGDFIVEVHRDWAPVGAQRFYELVNDGFYNNSGFFRVVPNFVVQFGIAADPKLTKKWDKKIKDDPVQRTNALYTMTYAKTGEPNSRTAQVFINLRSNQTLDADGFAPFGKVIEGTKVVDSLSSAHGELPDQQQIERKGTPYLKQNFPKLDYIKKAAVL